MPKGSNTLIIAGDLKDPSKGRYSIDWPTVNFHDEGGFNAHTLGCATGFPGAGPCRPDGSPRQPAKGLEGHTMRYRKRHIANDERTLAAAQAIIKQFVIHLDGCKDADMCFDVLHNERGLSCHFVLDNDGTIYQTLDLIDCAYHAAGLNETSIGIEMCNRGNAALYPNYYSWPGAIKRDEVVCYVNETKYVAYDFTPQQYAAMEVLGKTLAKLLPGIKLDYPHATSGDQSWDTIDKKDITSARLRESYTGYLGHYHITDQKWDPGPFDFKKYIAKLSGHRSFPIGLHKLAGKTEIPNAPAPGGKDRAAAAAYDKIFDTYYTNNEYDAEQAGGYFPVGPLDESAQLWHDGIHLHAEVGTKVVAPLPGEVVVVRNGPETTTVGSTNFVLIKHTPRIEGVNQTFFTLLYHLQEEKPGKKGDRLKWMAGDDWQEAEPGRIVVFKQPVHVQAGDVVGHVGEAGPDFQAEIHWEVFAPSHEPIRKIDKKSFWHEISGKDDQRICTNKEILDKIDKSPKDGIISHQELEDAFQGDPADHLWTHNVVASHYSEWSDWPDWKAALLNAPEFVKKGKAGEREATKLFEDQISPGIWLTSDVAGKIGLPANTALYFYHPVSFLRFLNDVMATKDTGGLKKATKADLVDASRSGKVDIDDTDGSSMITENDAKPIDFLHNITLPDMVDGYGD